MGSQNYSTAFGIKLKEGGMFSDETWPVIINEGQLNDAEENDMTLLYVSEDMSAGGDGNSVGWKAGSAPVCR
jgi:hypothetical protein